MIERDRERERQREIDIEMTNSTQHNSYVTRAKRHEVRNKMVFQFEQVFQ